MRSTLSDRHHGFSLLEIVLALAVLSILFGTVVPLLTKYNEALSRKLTLAEMQKVEAALLNFYRDTGTLPTGTTGDDLHLLIASTSLSHPGFDGPYLSALPDNKEIRDSWGEVYTLEYAAPAVVDVRTTQTFTLSSKGSDFDINTTNDNLTIVGSTHVVGEEVLKDTLERLRVVMTVVAELQLDVAHSNIFTELATSATGYALAEDSQCEAPEDGAIDHSALVQRLSCFHRRDQWGNPLLWHDDTNQFYSVGPNRADNTSVATTILPGDIGGSF